MFVVLIVARATLAYDYCDVNVAKQIELIYISIGAVVTVPPSQKFRNRWVVQEVKLFFSNWFQYYAMDDAVDNVVLVKQSLFVMLHSKCDDPNILADAWLNEFKDCFNRSSWIFDGSFSCHSSRKIAVKMHTILFCKVLHLRASFECKITGPLFDALTAIGERILFTANGSAPIVG